MTSDSEKFILFQPKSVDRGAFVAFWASQYSLGDENYDRHIRKPLCRDGIIGLFEWKNGSRLSAKKLASVEANFVGRLSELERIPEVTTAEVFLKTFPSGGAIFRIFWLHCWQPARFPIYDQHVHRAMTYIEDQQSAELGTEDDAEKVRLYCGRYLRFWESFDGFDGRAADRALWAFGKFIKDYPRFV